MNISGINLESIVDGEGVRTTIFISGCCHNCEGCHNKEAQDFNYGEKFTEDKLYEIINYIKERPYIKGITFSGGDPICSSKELIEYVKIIKKELSDVDIWVYTGYNLEDILDKEKELLSLVDIVVDGKFILSQKSVILPYRGSKNQRIIDIQKSLQSEKIIEKTL